MKEMRRVVRPGGLVCVIEHNPLNPLTRLAVARCEFDRDTVLLGAGKARKLMAAGGLREIGTRGEARAPRRRRFQQPAARRAKHRFWHRLSYFFGAARRLCTTATSSL